MKVNKLYLSLIVGLMLFGISNAQNQKPSKVIVSEADLVSLVKILKAHQDKNTEQKSASPDFEPKRIVQVQNKNNKEIQVNTSEQERLYSEIREIKAKLKELLNKPAPQQSFTESDQKQNSTIINNTIETKGSQTSQKEKAPTSKTNPDSISNTQEVLLKRIDSILKPREVRQNKLVENQTSDNADSKIKDDKILEKLDLQNKLIDSLIQRQSLMEKRLSQNTSETKTLERLTYSVFFDHDSHQLDSKYKSNLDKVAALLKSDAQLKVVLNAYASQTGDAEYNKKLSMLRAEAVKSYLKSKDISADRILSDYHGSDPSLEASSARRVEISYRK